MALQEFLELAKEGIKDGTLEPEEGAFLVAYDDTRTVKLMGKSSPAGVASIAHALLRSLIKDGQAALTRKVIEDTLEAFGTQEGGGEE